MTQHNTLNVKLSNSQLNRLKLGIKNGSEVTSNLSSNVIGDSNYETKFPHKLLLTDKQVFLLRIAFANGLSANIKLSKTQLSKMLQLWRFIAPISRFLVKNCEKLVRNIQPELVKKITKYFADKEINMLNQRFTQIEQARNLNVLRVGEVSWN